jgi:hypothetical protein
MSDRAARPPSAFRLNFEQQKNRAKDLLHAAKSGDESALARIAAACPSCKSPGAPIKLADAQLALARELRFSNWGVLKRHIESMDMEREAVDRQNALDADLKTLHIRCGSDIRSTLQEASFVGDFLEHSIPYCMGPVSTAANRHELMAKFLVEAFPSAQGGLVYERELESLIAGEQALHRSAIDYQRVVLWMEHDSWDQLVLVRLLAHYARTQRPAVLELIAIEEFPGGERFIGLGQLPAEALRMLWPSRRVITADQLELAFDAWIALAAQSPQALARILKSGTGSLPLLAPALHRHLRELPSLKNGLSLTEHIVLDILSEGAATLSQVFYAMKNGREPLPWLGDLGLLNIAENMLRATEPVVTRAATPEAPFAQLLTITDIGREVLAGKRDWLSLAPPPRWVGGVRIGESQSHWRWDETSRNVVLV